MMKGQKCTRVKHMGVRMQERVAVIVTSSSRYGVESAASSSRCLRNYDRPLSLGASGTVATIAVP
jgi:hypothetical protein